ncbi:MAG: OmpA family protein [Mariprofundaceae bacterium]
MLSGIAMVAVALLGAQQTRAATIEQVEQAIASAEQLRAAEFSPGHYARAKALLDEARQTLRSGGDSASVVSMLDQAAVEARQAAETAQRFSELFAALVESRDRLQLAGEDYVRKDLAERAEREFRQVVESFEDGNEGKARREAGIAAQTIHAGQVVAARERYVRPITKTIAGARRVKANTYAPKALKHALQTQRALEQLIKENPDADTQAYALSQKGVVSAKRALRIAELGNEFSRNPAAVESWMDAEDARMAMLGKALGVQLSRAQTPEEQLAVLQRAVADMKAGYEAQIADADAQVKELSAKLAKYEGELSDMAEIRRKLQLKREAEAKIKRLAGLFNPDEVEVLLTPDADVILRLKALNFRSGSAVIPPNSYAMLDNVVKSIELFPKRKVRIEGHTDSVGSAKYNQVLSERRANAVRDYLLQRLPGGHPGVDAAGFGEDKPIANNETAEGRKKNRRIDIVLTVPR